MNKILFIVGTRPNFVKLFPIYESLNSLNKYNLIILHTGQHYDQNMSSCFINMFKLNVIDLNIQLPKERENRIQIISSHLIDKIKEINPKLVIVFGDVDSSLAGLIASYKLKMPIAHVESGNRSYDLTMPEEINRLIIDQYSDYHFVSEPNGMINLLQENIIEPENINKTCFYTGNPMIDTLIKFKNEAIILKSYENFGLEKYKYALLTLHRPCNVDNFYSFEEITNMIKNISKKYKIIFPTHPRIKDKMSQLNEIENIVITEPLDYINFLNLLINSGVVITDSGGISEETTFLGIPCITLRNSTERPITITHGTNILIDYKNYKKVMEIIDKNFGKRFNLKPIKYWDGKAGIRISQQIDKIIDTL